ncbi:hypothetical protein FQA39_LY12661 [Lamprigera yunnana]|nr:hypothetical protein FQA39_LY12661 [Lamprigera yunnana]
MEVQIMFSDTGFEFTLPAMRHLRGYAKFSEEAMKRKIAVFTVKQELRKKWQILRTGYRTRRGEKYLPSGSGAKPIKKWVYFDSLMFLEPYMTERNTNLKKVSNKLHPVHNVSSQSYAKAYMLNDYGILVSDEAEESDQNTEEYNSKQILT